VGDGEMFCTLKGLFYYSPGSTQENVERNKSVGPTKSLIPRFEADSYVI
jgi:hypothetical protein